MAMAFSRGELQPAEFLMESGKFRLDLLPLLVELTGRGRNCSRCRSSARSGTSMLGPVVS